MSENMSLPKAATQNAYFGWILALVNGVLGVFLLPCLLLSALMDSFALVSTILFDVLASALVILPVFITLRYGNLPGLFASLLLLADGFFYGSAFGNSLAGILYAALSYLLPAYIAVTLLRKKEAFFTAVFASAVAAFAGVALTSLSFSWIWKFDIITVISESARSYLTQIDPSILDPYLSMLSQLNYLPSFTVLTDTLRSQFIDRFVYVLDVALRTYLPTHMMDYACLSGILGISLPLIWIRRKIPAQELTAFQPFETWRVSRGFTWGMLAMLLVTFIGYISGAEGFGIAVSVLWEIMVLAYAAQGLALIHFLLKKSGRSGGPWILVLVLAALVGKTLLGMIGMAEQIFDWRHLRVQDPPDDDSTDIY